MQNLGSCHKELHEEVLDFYRVLTKATCSTSSAEASAIKNYFAMMEQAGKLKLVVTLLTADQHSSPALTSIDCHLGYFNKKTVITVGNFYEISNITSSDDLCMKAFESACKQAGTDGVNEIKAFGNPISKTLSSGKETLIQGCTLLGDEAQHLADYHEL